MTLDPRPIAIQGFELTPIALAVQGFIESLKKQDYNPTDAGKAGTNPQRDYLSENLRRQWEQRQQKKQLPQQPDDYNITRLHQEDAMVAELIVALVTKGFFDGNR